MPKNDKQKKIDTSEIEDLEDLAELRIKKKIQNEALKKIVDKLNAKNE